MAIDQLEADLREFFADQAAGVPVDALATITSRNYHPRTHSTLTPLALGAGVAAVAAIASVAATSGKSPHRATPNAHSPAGVNVTTAAKGGHAAVTGAHTTLTLDGYRISLPTAKAVAQDPGWNIWAPDCSSGKASNSDCPAVAVLSLGPVPDGVVKHEATTPDGKTVTWYVAGSAGNTTEYFPVTLADGRVTDLGLQVEGGAAMSDADAIAFASGIHVVS